ncbi:MAG: aminopeptidase [Acidobacteriota bacterium]
MNEHSSLDRLFDRYAHLLVHHGAGLRPGQTLYLQAEVSQRDLAYRVAEAAYDAGAADVSVWLIDPRLRAQGIRRARPELVEARTAREALWYEEILRVRGALVSLRGDEDPRLMPELAEAEPERHGVYTRGQSRKGKIFLHHGVNRSLCPWVVAGAATPAWGQLVFPDLSSEEAHERLWREIFAFTRADRADALDALAEKDRRLHARRRLLNALEIRELRIVGGGSDLRVRLSDRAQWLGGSKTTVDGQTFNANVPSEENFTTPDRRATEGTLVATMPFRTKSGLLVEGLTLRFEAGRVVDFDATRGGDGFRRWIDSDDGGRFLGEFALVGADSPIAQSGLFFEHTLFDENAWSHVALGQAYTTALQGGEDLTSDQLAAVGCNHSVIHTDIMFGSPEVSVIATETARGEVLLLDKGHWVEPFKEATD